MTSASGAVDSGRREADDPAPAIRLRWGATISGSVVVTLVRPLSWAVGLAGFLAGGGLVLVTWPILVLPTPTGLQNALGGPVSSLVFGAPSGALVALIVGGLAGGVVLFGVGLLLGAWAERQGIGIALDAAAEEGIVDAGHGPRWSSGHGPRRARPAAGARSCRGRDAARLAAAVRRDLPRADPARGPRDATPAAGAPGPAGLVAAIVVTWLVSDAAGAVGVRRLVLERRPVLAAWLLGWADLVRRPQRILPTALVGVAATLLVAGPGLIAAALGWGRVRDVIDAGDDPIAVLVAVVIWVSVWLGALVLAGVAAAFRTATWTLELPRPAPRDT